MNYKIQKHKRHHLVYTTSTRLLPGALYSLHKSSPPPPLFPLCYIYYIVLELFCCLIERLDLKRSWGGRRTHQLGPIYTHRERRPASERFYIYIQRTHFIFIERDIQKISPSTSDTSSSSSFKREEATAPEMAGESVISLAGLII